MTFEIAFLLVLCGPVILAALMQLCGWAADTYDDHAMRRAMKRARKHDASPIKPGMTAMMIRCDASERRRF